MRAEFHPPYDSDGHERPRPHGSEPDRLPPHRRRPHVPVQLAVRARARRRDPAPDREHRHEPGGGGGDVDQIKESLIWLGIDWDGDVHFQLDTADKARRARRTARLRGQGLRGRGRDPVPPAEGRDGLLERRRPRPHRVPERAAAGPRDRPLGRSADLQLRLAGRRRVRRDHPRDPRRGPRLEHADADQHPARARRRPARLRACSEHQRRRRPQAVEAAQRRRTRRLPRRRLPARRRCFNFLALLGWSYDDKTTIMSRHELVERFDLDRVVPSPATFDYQKLDWLNGVYLRNLQPDEYAHWLCKWLAEHGIDWPRDLVHATVPLVEEKIETFAQYPDFVRFLFEDVTRRRRRPANLPAAHERLRDRRAVGGVPPRGRAACARRRARREAAHRVSADPARDHRLEDLAGPVREPRAARQGEVARAARRGGAGLYGR